MKFNKKLERFYGQYTDEIKQNLERGTAVQAINCKKNDFFMFVLKVSTKIFK